MCSRKTKIGITGGIGSGKSYVCAMLAERGFPVFYCDDNARAEMLENGELRDELRRLVSPDVFREDGQLNKPVIRRFLHSSPENAALFDGVVHPYVRMRWRRWAGAQTCDVVVMECALLFEAAFDSEVDLKVLVTAPDEMRVSRVMKRDGIDEHTVKRWIDMQMPDGEKELLSDFTIINDGSRELGAQLDELLAKIHS